MAAPAVAPIRPDAFQRRIDAVTCEGKDSTDTGWGEPRTAVGTSKPARVPLRPQGCENIPELLWRVEMVKSARRAVTGAGVCIGLTYRDQAFTHPKAKKC